MITVLHIERSQLIVQSVKTIVESVHNQYISCTNEKDAFNILKSKKIDLVITAIEIDTHDEEDIITILNHSKYNTIPILVFTSTDTIETREKLFELGIVDYVVKNTEFENKLLEYFLNFKLRQPISMDFTELPVAVLDDSLLSLKIIKTILENNNFMNTDYYSDPLDLLKSDKKYSVYFLDLVLPNMSGENVMMELRKSDPNAIIILVSMISHYKTISNILVKGADDYILKPFDENIFMGRLRTHIRTYMLMKELEQKNIILEEMANKDGLTGLYNHRFIIERLSEEASRISRNDSDLSCIMLDIDHFKKINDNYGHPVGDKVLKIISKIIKQNLRTSDIVGRYGGEEFLVILPDTNQEKAMIVSNKIRERIASFVFKEFNEKITISGGVSSFNDNTYKEVIAEADKNLYKSKNSGRNKITG